MRFVLQVLGLILVTTSSVIGSEDNVVTDGSEPNERDNTKVAEVAVIVTVATCVIAAILCLASCGLCCYQKCIVDGCSI